jgi:hypothetical protein
MRGKVGIVWTVVETRAVPASPAWDALLQAPIKCTCWFYSIRTQKPYVLTQIYHGGQGQCSSLKRPHAASLLVTSIEMFFTLIVMLHFSIFISFYIY